MTSITGAHTVGQTGAVAHENEQDTELLRIESAFINVKDHGAVGNGVTDDTTAVQAAITAAGAGGTVWVAAGTNSNTVVALDLATAQAVTAGAGMLWAKLTRNGTSGSDTATTVDARVIGVMLTRTL